jgi:hypothetical protein
MDSISFLLTLDFRGVTIVFPNRLNKNMREFLESNFIQET